MNYHVCRAVLYRLILKSKCVFVILICFSVDATEKVVFDLTLERRQVEFTHLRSSDKNISFHANVIASYCF